MNEHSVSSQPQPEAPKHRVRLPGFVADREVGLGDLVTRVTYSVGLAPCGGCQRRAEALNRWMTIGPRRT
jgi:hypothetical protein